MLSCVFLYLILVPDCIKCGYSVAPMAILGFTYCVYGVVVWSAIPYVVQPYAVGTAFGVVVAVLNLGLAVAPVIVGWLCDITGNYEIVTMFFFVCGLMSVASSLLLQINDEKTGRVLNAPCIYEDEMSLSQDLSQNESYKGLSLNQYE